MSGKGGECLWELIVPACFVADSLFKDLQSWACLETNLPKWRLFKLHKPSKEPCTNENYTCPALPHSKYIMLSDHKLMTGRYNETPHNDRFCPVCNSGIIEDEFHFLLHCLKYSIRREKFYNKIQQNFVDFNQLSCTELIINELMNSQNFSVNSYLLKSVSLCNDLRSNLLSYHTDDTWLTIVIIALYYH